MLRVGLSGPSSCRGGCHGNGVCYLEDCGFGLVGGCGDRPSDGCFAGVNRALGPPQFRVLGARNVLFGLRLQVLEYSRTPL